MSGGRAAPEPSQEAIDLLYDYSKHLLSLALLGIGGVVSLAQSPQGLRIPRLVVSMVLGALAISGSCSLSCSASILQARQRGEVVKPGAWLASRLAMMFLGIGVGGFLMIWIKAF